MIERIKAITWYQWAAMAAAGLFLSGMIEMLLPWHEAQQISTTRAIEIFGSGESSGNYFLAERSAALAGFLLLFIAGPALLFHYFLADSGEESSPRPLSSFSLWAGMILVISGFTVAAGTSIVYPVVLNNTMQEANESAHKDQLRAELSELSLQAAEYLFLPADKQGGAGSFEQFELEKLPKYHELQHAQHITAGISADTLLTIQIIGQMKGQNTDFQNPDGSTGNIQIRSTVSPGKLLKMVDEN